MTIIAEAGLRPVSLTVKNDKDWNTVIKLEGDRDKSTFPCDDSTRVFELQLALGVTTTKPETMSKTEPAFLGT